MTFALVRAFRNCHGTKAVDCGPPSLVGALPVQSIADSVRANRIGLTQYNVGQLKIMQEVSADGCSFPLAVLSQDSQSS